MRRKTLLESIGVVLLLAVAANIAWSRFQANRAAPQTPTATPTPRMRSLVRARDAQEKTQDTRPAPDTPDSEPSADAPPSPQTGFLVVEVREADGSVPTGPVTLVNRELDFVRDVEDGRLVLESVAGPVSFMVVAEERTEGPLTATVRPSAATELVFTLPEPEPKTEPVLVSAGLELAPDEEFYVVAAVAPGSPAAAAGLQPGDAVLEVGNAPVTELTPEEIALSLLGAPGDRVFLRVVIRNRQDEFEEHHVELVLHPF